MAIYLGSQQIDKQYVDSWELGPLYLGSSLISEKVAYNSWSPVSQSVLYGFYDTNDNVTGSFNNSTGNWNIITGSSGYSWNKTTNKKTLIQGNPNFINCALTPSNSYLQMSGDTAGGEFLMQFWIAPVTSSTNPNHTSSLYEWTEDQDVLIRYDGTLNTMTWTMRTANSSSVGFSFKSVSQSLDPNDYNNKFINVAFSFNQTAGSYYRKYYVNGQLITTWNNLDEKGLPTGVDNEYLLGYSSPFLGKIASMVYYRSFPVSGSNDDAVVLANYNASKDIYI